MSNQVNQQKKAGSIPGQMFMRGGRGSLGRVEKAKDFKGTWLKIVKYIKSYLPAILITLIISMIGTTLRIIGPDKLKSLSNEIEKGLPFLVDGEMLVNSININAVLKIAWVLIFLYLGYLLLDILQGYLMATITQKISKVMRTDIAKKINRLPFKYFDKTSYGDVLSRVVNDVDTVGQAMDQGLSTIVSAITMLIGTLVMMIYNSWMLALVAIVFSLLGFVFMSIIIKKSQKYFVIRQESLGEINGHVEEIYSSHNIVKAYGGFSEAQKIFEEINQTLYNTAIKSQFLSGLMMPMMHFISNFGYVAVSIIGAILVTKGVISFGVIVAFMIYIRLFTQPLSRIAQAFNSLQLAAAAAERVFEFLEEPELANEKEKIKKLINIKGKVEFRNVKFAYISGNHVIHNFSVQVQPGQKIAIVGPTGAGKTTIVNLLMRFYEIDSGEILLDDINTNQVPRENVHEQFSMVLQNTWLFNGTIKENIIFNKTGVSDKEVVEACKTVGLDHFIQTLPEGYKTKLDDRVSLSEGQKQLLTIARATIQNAPLLILDEATSSVDTRTERIVQQAMDRLMANRTSFVIAHRLSTIKNADLILVLRDGDIVESGNHEKLLNQGGFYAELYNSQFENK